MPDLALVEYQGIAKSVLNMWNSVNMFMLFSVAYHYLFVFFIQVMADGQVAEFDHPYILLKNEDGHFHQMARYTGQLHFDILRDQAKASYQQRRRSQLYLEHGDDHVVKVTHL